MHVIDRASDVAGRLASWLCIAIILVVAIEVFMRFVLNQPTSWAYNIAIMAGATMYALAFCYTHRNHRHVRVDVIYTRLPARGKAIIDVMGAFLVFLPLLFVITHTSLILTWEAWIKSEVLAETSWLPPLAPMRAMVTLGLVLFLFQGIAHLVRDLKVLVRGR